MIQDYNNPGRGDFPLVKPVGSDSDAFSIIASDTGFLAQFWKVCWIRQMVLAFLFKKPLI
jgi:hypothetical protein